MALFPLTVGLAANEGLKSVDIRNNNITAKGLHALETSLRTNITLLELCLSETETLLVTGDDIIIGDAETSPSGQQGHQAKIERLLESNNALSKVSPAISPVCFVSDAFMESFPAFAHTHPF